MANRFEKRLTHSTVSRMLGEFGSFSLPETEDRHTTGKAASSCIGVEHGDTYGQGVGPNQCIRPYAYSEDTVTSRGHCAGSGSPPRKPAAVDEYVRAVGPRSLQRNVVSTARVVGRP